MEGAGQRSKWYSLVAPDQARAPSPKRQRARRSVLAVPADLQREVVLVAERLHQRQLRLEVVDVLLLAGEDALEQQPGDGVVDLAAQRDAAAQRGDGVDLDPHVGLELLADLLADP